MVVIVAKSYDLFARYCYHNYLCAGSFANRSTVYVNRDDNESVYKILGLKNFTAIFTEDVYSHNISDRLYRFLQGRYAFKQCVIVKNDKIYPFYLGEKRGE